jgi:hypothetical protein
MNEQARGVMIGALGDVIMALCRNGGARVHWEATSTAAKVFEVVTHPEFFEVVATEDRAAYEVRFRRDYGTGYGIMTLAAGPTPADAILRAWDVLQVNQAPSRLSPERR